VENISEQALVEKISALAPLLQEHAAMAEQQRKPVDEVMLAIEAAGAYRYFVPKRYGGYEFSLLGFMHLGMALGAGCLSTAWVTTFCMEHNWLLSLFDEPAQEDIFSKHPYIIAPGSLAPNGHAAKVAGGYRLTGRWQWATGIMHANWVMAGAAIPYENGKPQLGMFLVPRSEVEVVDTWFVDGMVGTGSNDISIKDVFVPAHRVVDLSLLLHGRSPGAIFHQSSLYRAPMIPFLGLTAAAPAVGAATKAVDLFQERMQGRTIYGTRSKQADKPISQARLASARIRITNVRQQIFNLAEEVMRFGNNEAPCPNIDIARLRLHIAHTVHEARNIIIDVVSASGASAHFLDNPLQRIQRDINTLVGHTVFDLDIASETYGAMLLSDT